MTIRVSAWAIRNPTPVVLIIIALTLAGLVSYLKLPIKQYPNVEFPIVLVSVTQSGAAPAEVESQITRPIEDALAGIAGLRHISSTVSLGTSSTTAEFELGTDLQKATDDVRTAVEQARVQLPAGIDPPTTRRLDIAALPITTYAISAPAMTTAQLSWFVDNTVARALQAQSGVSQVARVGGISREINVTLDPARLAAFKITAAQVNTALTATNLNDTGGRANLGGAEQTIRVLGEATDVAAIAATTIPIATGGYVRLSDIATIDDGASEQRSFARLDGRPVVAFQVSKTKAASDVSTEDRVKKAVAALEAANPGITFTKIVSTVDYTRRNFAATMQVLIEGMLLAALIVYLFLRSWRATIIAALAMPLSLVPTFAAMVMFGFSLNNVTLLGLTLVIGILVDDAIVEIENIEKRIEAGASPYRAALIGADSIGLAVIATTATIVAVFAPVSFMPGEMGQFFREFGLTVSMAVLFSLVVARFLTPVLAAYFLTAKPSQPHRPVPRFYEKALDWNLAHPWPALGVGTAMLAGSLALATTLPTGFNPIGNTGIAYLSVEGPQGATLAQMERAIDQVTKSIEAQPDVERVFAQVGAEGSLFSGHMTVILKHQRSMTTDQFQRSLTGLLRAVPDVRIATEGGGLGQVGLEVVLTGNDSAALAHAQLELVRQMRGLPQVLEPRPAPPPAAPELVIRPRPGEAARLQVSARTIAQAMRVATIGDIDANVAKFSTQERRIPIRIRLSQPDRENPDVISSLRLPTLSGKTTTLGSVADMSLGEGPGQIVRYDRERRVSVKADLNNVTLGQALKEVNKLPIMRHLPPGVHLAQTGDTEAMTELFGNIIITMLSGIGLIYGVLVLLFRSFFKPITIISALPLTLIGAFIALKLMGLAITLPVLIGMLMLLGLAAKNSILLVEFAIEDERAGQSQRDAIINACRVRARPIVMTSVAMAAGMLPTAIGLGEGSSFRQPMAVAVIGGLLSSTVLALLLVPVVYELIERIECRLRPRLARFATPRAPGDDDPIDPTEEGVVSAHP
ncbi:hydrophobic/amphiphilic exporter-1, HAE1 family [Sphingomonas sp. YR710]|uniref:efflux RND transporter permease subunit n=1 Tax=Sphingomonas sp. YR710 TaxID=1882773 RepID=UPI0008920FBC|nr:efflux RND transporter permease subunit [Sphingomonas sp. YR710]SDD61141.1 hydrophobic/amphiphilic exporter-1, HAE1 family [Sphingomonas sp. YR710]